MLLPLGVWRKGLHSRATAYVEPCREPALREVTGDFGGLGSGGFPLHQGQQTAAVRQPPFLQIKHYWNAAIPGGVICGFVHATMAERG